MSPATSNEGTATSVKSEAKTNNTSTTNSKQTTYPTDDLNLPRATVELVKAVDGDTISVMFEGKKENVRMLLIDTPETSHPKLGVQPFGPEAKAFTKDLVEQADLLELNLISVRTGINTPGRLRMYMPTEKWSRNRAEEGLARVAYIYPPNTRYVDKFDDLRGSAGTRRSGYGA